MSAEKPYHVVMTGGHGHSGGTPPPLGYSVWEYSGQDWALKKVCADNGGVPSEPPTIQGKFKGQLRATPCVAASA